MEDADTSLITDLLEKPANLSIAAKNTALNGFVYLGAGALLGWLWCNLSNSLVNPDSRSAHRVLVY
jgi:hypothetical protein